VLRTYYEDALESYQVLVDAERVISDTLFTESQEDYNNGENFLSSRLARGIQRLFNHLTTAIFWYASDFDYMPILHTQGELLQEIEYGIRKPECEVYLLYKADIS
jgi:hypothetical protein